MERLRRTLRALFAPPHYPPGYAPVSGHAVHSYDKNYFLADTRRRARVAYEAAKRNLVADDPNP